MIRPRNFDLQFPMTCPGLGCCRGALLCVLIAGLSSTALLGAAAPTTTTLEVPNGAVVWQSPVTLKATVQSNGVPVSPGQVVFCDGKAKYCEDLAVLGKAQLKSDGTASIKLLLSVGTHSVYARFSGTASYPGSTSLPTVQTVTVIAVSGQLRSVPSVSTSGLLGSLTLSSTLAEYSTTHATGPMMFVDAATNRTIATAPLTPFSTGPALASGFYPTNAQTNGPVATGDFNNDGVLDVVVASASAGIDVLLADPAHPGQYTSPDHSYGSASFPYAIAVADLDGDGFLDIVTINSQTNDVSVFLGDSQHPGQFLPEQAYSAGTGPFALAIADFNGDGLPDLAVTNSAGTSVSILFADIRHPGQFLPLQAVPNTGSLGPYTAIVAADLNGDGVPDLILGNEQFSDPSDSAVEVLLADPAHPGTFFSAIPYSAGLAPASIAVGDFNGDGLPDLAVANFGTVSPATINVLLADEAHPGTFLAPTTYAEGTNVDVNAIVTGDFNGDGVLDLAVAHEYGENAGTYINLGDPAHPGRFMKAVNYPMVSIYGTSNLAVADLNGDGLSDIATAELPYLRMGDTYGQVSILDVQLGLSNDTATVSNVNLPASTFVYASYPGEANYHSSTSCEIAVPAGTPGYPVISGVTVSNISTTSATVSWSSNVPTTGTVHYGTSSTNLSEGTRFSPAALSSHSITLSGLPSATTIYYQPSSVSYFNGCNHWTTLAPVASFSTKTP